MIYVVTVHWRSARWIDVQRSYLERNMAHPYRVFASLEGIDPVHRSKFAYVSDFSGTHAEKLNELAATVIADADPEDLLVFIDGDAFPVRPLGSWLASTLTRHPLLAVRRAENLGDPQPHPCFCATTVGLWSDIQGDWQEGHRWTNSVGESVTDVGGNLLALLEQRQIDWLRILRTNTVDFHPLHFGIYGDHVYHHGAGFRTQMSRIDTATSPSARLLARITARSGRNRSLRRRIAYRLARRTLDLRKAANRELDDQIYAAITRDPEFFLRFLTHDGAATAAAPGLPA